MLERRKADEKGSERQILQAHSEREAGQKVLGVGSCGLDYLAVVARYPEPDTRCRCVTCHPQCNLLNFTAEEQAKGAEASPCDAPDAVTIPSLSSPLICS